MLLVESFAVAARRPFGVVWPCRAPYGVYPACFTGHRVVFFPGAFSGHRVVFILAQVLRGTVWCLSQRIAGHRVVFILAHVLQGTTWCFSCVFGAPRGVFPFARV